MTFRRAALVLLVALGLAAPLAVYPVFLMKAMCFALFACSFGLLISFAGLLSFGHAAFFGMAAYVCGYAMKVWQVNPELALFAGTAVAAALGLAIGWFAIRREGIYFAMITLALAQIVYFFCLQAPFTHGEDGIQAIPRGKLFGLVDLSQTMSMYYLVLAVFVAGCLAVNRVVESPFGQVVKAIRENESRAISLGYRTGHHKLLAFVLSAALSGLAGATKALVFQLATLTDVHWHMSAEVVLMTLLGGIGTVTGPAVGAFVITGMQHYFASAGAWITILQGLVFIACVLSFRRGIVGEVSARITSGRMLRCLQKESSLTRLDI